MSIRLTFENSRWVCTTPMLRTIDKTPERALYHALLGNNQIEFPNKRIPTSEDYLTPEGKLSVAGQTMLDMEGRIKFLNEEIMKDYPDEHLNYLLGELDHLQTMWDMQFPHLRLRVPAVSGA